MMWNRKRCDLRSKKTGVKEYATKILTLSDNDSIMKTQSNCKNFVTISKWVKK